MAFIRFLTLTRHSSINEEMPSQFEQDISEAYVCNRQISRPDITIWKAIKKVAIITLATVLLALILNYIFYSFGLFTHLPIEIQKFQSDSPKLFIILFAAGLGFFVFFSFYDWVRIFSFPVVFEKVFDWHC